MRPFAARGWTSRPDLVSLPAMGVVYNPETQQNELRGVSIACLPQFMLGSDHTSTSNQDDDDYTSDR